MMSDYRNLRWRYNPREIVTEWVCDQEAQSFTDLALRLLLQSPLAWQMTADGIQMYPASDASHQWVRQSCRCPYCGHTWEAIAPLGSTGIECPACHEVDLSFEWKER